MWNTIVIVPCLRLGTAGEDEGELQHAHKVAMMSKIDKIINSEGMFECFYLRWMKKSNTGSSRNTCMEDRRGLVIPTTGMEHFGSPFLLFPLQRNVQNGGGPYDTAGGVGRCNSLLRYLLDFHQRMRDITRTQLCTKEVKIVNTELVPHSARNSC